MSTRPLGKPQRRARRSFGRVFAWPSAIAASSLVGLIVPLVGDGVCDAVSWVLLGGIVVLMVRHLLD